MKRELIQFRITLEQGVYQDGDVLHGAERDKFRILAGTLGYSKRND